LEKPIVYLSACGLGIGGRPVEATTEASEAAGIWALQAAIFPENPARIALHEKYGYRMVDVRERIGRIGHGPFAGRWRDAVLMERRSTIVGTE
jgi:phosphinothricin acetyltransferase